MFGEDSIERFFICSNANKSLLDFSTKRQVVSFSRHTNKQNFIGVKIVCFLLADLCVDKRGLLRKRFLEKNAKKIFS